MSGIDINLSDFIEPIMVNMGHVFTFNELGAIDELALSQALLRAEAISKKKNLTDKDNQEVERLIRKAYDMTLHMFDDGRGGKVTEKVLGGLPGFRNDL